MKTIVVTAKNVELFSKMQNITKIPEIGSVLTIVKEERPYTNKRGYFAIVTDLTPSANTLAMIERKNHPDAPKYGWDKMAELGEEVIAAKKIESWYAFNRWYIDMQDLKEIRKRSN